VRLLTWVALPFALLLAPLVAPNRAARADVSTGAAPAAARASGAEARPVAVDAYRLRLGERWVHDAWLREWTDPSRRVERVNVRGRIERTIVAEERVGRGVLFHLHVRALPRALALGEAEDELWFAIDDRIYAIDSLASARAIAAGAVDGREPIAIARNAAHLLSPDANASDDGCDDVELHSASSVRTIRFCSVFGLMRDDWNHFAGSQLEKRMWLRNVRDVVAKTRPAGARR
jgi:hypothetical protein